MRSAQKWSSPALAIGSTSGEAFLANVAAAAAQIHANAANAIEDSDPEHLHQLRVGIRRLRSTLRAFSDLVQRRRARQFDRELRSIMRTLGPVRDWDVFLHSRMSPDLRVAARRHSAAARRSMRNAMIQMRLGLLLRRVLAWARHAPWRASADPQEPLGKPGARALRRLFEAACDAADGIDWANATRRHRVRIRLKRLRYGYDCFAAGFQPEAAAAFLHRLKQLQHLLGELNDIAVQRKQLRDLARGAGLARPIAGARTRLAARERQLIGEVAKVWPKFEAHPPHWRRQAVRARG